MSRIKSYIPESEFFDSKHLDGCRIFHDDCAIVSAAEGFPLVASRGFSIPAGTPFFEALSVSASETAKLKAFLASDDTCLLLRCKKHTLIVFSALLQHTGLLVILRVRFSQLEVKRAMKKDGRDAFYPIFRPDGASESEVSAREHINEIFYYTDRILHAIPALPFTARIRLIANFVGCRVEIPTVSLNVPTIEQRHTDILIAFFLCIFLILRQKTGENTIAAESDNVGKVQENPEESVPAFFLSLKHSQTSNFQDDFFRGKKKKHCDEEFPSEQLLSLPCFSNIFQFTEDGHLVFEIPIYVPSPYATLGAYGSSQCLLVSIALQSPPSASGN